MDNQKILEDYENENALVYLDCPYCNEVDVYSSDDKSVTCSDCGNEFAILQEHTDDQIIYHPDKIEA